MCFKSFLREKQYLENVSTNTLRWYRHALNWLPNEQPTEPELKEMVMRMREKGLKATGCNAAIRAINAYLHWLSKAPRKCGAGCTHPHITSLKEPELVLPTFTSQQVKRLIGFKPRTAFKRRLHFLVLLLLDSGCRISEALAVRTSDIDQDNLLITLSGKGRKQRKIPISFELRRALFKYLDGSKDVPLFLAASGKPWGRIGALRAVKLHCQKLGFEPPPRTLHAMRHTFATEFIKRGGSVTLLQRQLGHSTLAMTMRYVHVQTEDLSRNHERASLLAA